VDIYKLLKQLPQNILSKKNNGNEGFIDSILEKF
jgi:hypothetical protein